MGDTVEVEIEGGDKLNKYLRNLASRLGNGGEVAVGFFEGATYPAQQKKHDAAGVKIQGRNAGKRRARNLSATHGVDDEGDEQALHVAQVAFWQEFGTEKGIPPRPFFRNFIADQMPTWAQKLGMAARYTGYRPKQMLEILGADMKGHLVESINILQDPPLSDRTVKEKGFSKPLIDTAVMIRSVGWEVNTGEPKE